MHRWRPCRRPSPAAPSARTPPAPCGFASHCDAAHAAQQSGERRGRVPKQPAAASGPSPRAGGAGRGCCPTLRRTAAGTAAQPPPLLPRSPAQPGFARWRWRPPAHAPDPARRAAPWPEQRPASATPGRHLPRPSCCRRTTAADGGPRRPRRREEAARPAPQLRRPHQRHPCPLPVMRRDPTPSRRRRWCRRWHWRR